MLQVKVDGNWLFCAILAASQLVGGCFRLHHEDTLGAAVQMLSGVGCLIALKRFRVAFIRIILFPAIVLSLCYEFSQMYNAVRYGPNVRSFRRLFWNCATLWSCIASFWFLHLWNVLLEDEIAKARRRIQDAKSKKDDTRSASPTAKTQDAEHQSTPHKIPIKSAAAAAAAAVDLLTSGPEVDDFLGSDTEAGDEPVLLSFG